MEIVFDQVIPVLRIFDIAKADDFYLGFLGFKIDWDHRFDPGAPFYRQISRGGLVLHLSEHHGDGSPGVHVRVMMRGVEAFHREISSKGLPLHAAGTRDNALGHDRDRRDRPLRQPDPFLRAD
jgi:catechol 2,3-dioxygenase-like lactoylglutathione lyase family enzyme